MADAGTYCTVTGNAQKITAESASGGKFIFELDKWDVTDNQIIINDHEAVAVVQADGTISVDLFRNVLGTTGSSYLITYEGPDGLRRSRKGRIIVPDKATEDLGKLVVTYVNNEPTLTPTLVHAAQEAATEAQQSAEAAQAFSLMPFDSRGDAEAANLSASVKRAAFLSGTALAEIVRGGAYPILSTADGGDWSAAGLTTPQHFGAVADDDTVDNTAAMNLFFDWFRLQAQRFQRDDPRTVENAPVMGWIPPGVYHCAGSINATKIVGLGWVANAPGAEIVSTATGKPVLDALGSRWGRIHGIRLIGDDTNTPLMAIQHGRIDEAGGQDSFDGMTFDHCQIDGYFSRTCVYNLASETSLHIAPRYYNSSTDVTATCMVYDGNNFLEAVSDYVPAGEMFSGVQPFSNIHHTVLHGDIRRFNAGAPLWLSRAKQVKFIKSYAVGREGPLVTLSDDGSGFAELYFDLHGETAGLEHCFRVEKQPQVASGSWVNIDDFQFTDHAHFASDSIFDIASNVPRCNLRGADIRIPQAGVLPTNGLSAQNTKLHIYGNVLAQPNLINNVRLYGTLRLIGEASGMLSNPVGNYTIYETTTGDVKHVGTESFEEITGNAVMQSPTDATAGRLMPVGAFGNGDLWPQLVDWSVTDNSIVPGHYIYNEGAVPASTGGPADVTLGHGWHSRRAIGGGETQVLVAESASGPTARPGEVFTRSRVAGGWTDWRRAVANDRVIGAVSFVGGTPTGGLFESGSGPNGGYRRTGDGTQECWHELTLEYNAISRCLATWTFPKSFPDGQPKITATISDVSGATPGTPEIGQLELGSVTSNGAVIRVVRISGLTDFAPGDTVKAHVKAIGKAF